MALVRRFGWIPVGQGISLLISTVGFAVLARTLGPGPFASFATILFVFTLTALLLDLSPQGYILVNGDARATVTAARTVAFGSGGAAAIAIFFAVPIVFGIAFTKPLGWLAPAMLALACAAQFLGQVPRSRLLIARRYRAIALVDVTATAASVSLAIGLSLAYQSVEVLCAQLLALALVRLASLVIIAKGLEPPRDDHAPGQTKFAVRYGISVMPLNVASYISRSLDTGVLPAILPPLAAAAYARSYQIVVTPVMQLQPALGPAILERFARASNDEIAHDLQSRTWRLLIVVTGAAAISIGCLSGWLAALLFGPGWPQATVFIAGMVCGLPSLTLATFIGWKLQLRGEFTRSLRQLLVLLLPPIVVISAAVGFGTQGALAALVGMGGITPPLVLLANRRILRVGPRAATMLLQTLSAWLLTVAIFIVISVDSGFWQFSNW